MLPVKTDDRLMTIAAPDLAHHFFRSKLMRADLSFSLAALNSMAK
jgi:hypothetical protein